MSRTVRKNTKEFAAAIAGAQNIKAYTLDNGFTGKAVQQIPAWLGNDFKLVHDGNGYSANVHSNLWYEFEVAA